MQESIFSQSFCDQPGSGRKSSDCLSLYCSRSPEGTARCATDCLALLPMPRVHQACIRFCQSSMSAAAQVLSSGARTKPPVLIVSRPSFIFSLLSAARYCLAPRVEAPLDLSAPCRLVAVFGSSSVELWVAVFEERGVNTDVVRKSWPVYRLPLASYLFKRF